MPRDPPRQCGKAEIFLAEMEKSCVGTAPSSREAETAGVHRKADEWQSSCDARPPTPEKRGVEVSVFPHLAEDAELASLRLDNGEHAQSPAPMQRGAESPCVEESPPLKQTGCPSQVCVALGLLQEFCKLLKRTAGSLLPVKQEGGQDGGDHVCVGPKSPPDCIDLLSQFFQNLKKDWEKGSDALANLTKSKKIRKINKIQIKENQKTSLPGFATGNQLLQLMYPLLGYHMCYPLTKIRLLFSLRLLFSPKVSIYTHFWRHFLHRQRSIQPFP